MASAIWIGLFEVAPNGRGEDPLEGAVGAFAYAAAEAGDRDSFIKKVEDAAAGLGLRVSAAEEVGKAMARGIWALSLKRHKLLSMARQSGTVAWGTYHSYETDSD
jgi:hypothetical protein